MNYYISDLHLGHENAMKRFDHRPFKSLEEQDNVIISNINSIVTPQDNLYLLGGVSWYKSDKTYELLNKINCKNRFLLVGNHDRWAKDSKCKKLFQGIYDLKKIYDNGRTVVLCHYPLAVWDQSHRGNYHLYGHVHKNLTPYGETNHTILSHNEMVNAYNVGCMLPYMNYKPRTLDEIINMLKIYE